MEKQSRQIVGSREVRLPQGVVDWLQQDAISSGLYPLTVGFYPKSKNSYNSDASVSNPVLFYCHNGRGVVTLDNVPCMLHSRQFMILPSSCRISLEPDISDPWSVYIIGFGGRMSGTYSDRFSLAHHSGEPFLCRNGEVESLFEKIYNTLSAGFSPVNLQYASSTLDFLLASLMYETDTSSHTDDKENDIFSLCVRYMHDNIENKIKIQDICNFSGYSESHCEKMYKSRTGMSPMKYLQHLRIERALELIQTTNLNINQICFMVGITDPYYFSRVFKSVTGRLPSSYRKK